VLVKIVTEAEILFWQCAFGEPGNNRLGRRSKTSALRKDRDLDHMYAQERTNPQGQEVDTGTAPWRPWRVRHPDTGGEMFQRKKLKEKQIILELESCLIELQAKLLNYFLGSNKSNINQFPLYNGNLRSYTLTLQVLRCKSKTE
jgi:hypothetical protein